MQISGMIVVVLVVLIFRNPFEDFFGLPGWALVAFAVPAAALALLFAVRHGILEGLPERPEAKPVDPANAVDGPEEESAALQRLGFVAAGPALDFQLGQSVTVYPFVNFSESAYATIACFEKGKVTMDFVTTFQGETLGLTSSPEVGAGCLPLEPGRFLQVLPEAQAPATLWAHHVRAAEWFRDRGFASDRPAAENIPRLLACALISKRELFLRNPWKHTGIALLRTLRKSTPYLGPLTSQADARAWLTAHPVTKRADPQSVAAR